MSFVLAELGLPPVREADLRGLVGEGVVRLLERALGAQASRVGEALPLFEAHYEAHLLDRTRAYDGVPVMLASAPQKKAVATNKPGVMARRIVLGLGLAEHFLRVLGDGDVKRRKPEAEMIEMLLKESGVSRDETLLIGDGRVDIRTARAAGVACCAVTWGYVARDALLAESPDHVVDTVPALSALLRV